ncbi:uncharacterized protein [Salmo salar]|uniref:TNFR-Cys domain-containing protein n=1 Tax=Salmo salar TaxID=8030 RepID=A0A1S3MV24_SALSA|nr:uncharacterized protein LOC106575203 [Salmo salar]|eukprot:XP_014007027.1 PREDICTED: uncharacterized protein LOC106575203 isoform X2 [Salmo salar]
MHLFWWITHIFLSLPSLLSLVQSLTCDQEKQYAWPQSVSQWCCDMCPPGQHMVGRCTGQNSPTQCANCTSGYYSDSYNFDRSCTSCDGCSMSELQYVSRCSTKQNDVCSCKPGYRCRGSGPCLDCEEIPSPNTPKLIPTPPIMPATASNHSVSGMHNHRSKPVTKPGTGHSTKPNQDDSKWLPVCVSAVCVCLLLTCLVAISKLKPVLRWIGSTNSFWSPKKTTPANQSTADEEVPMPVQEVCGKPELLLDV